MVEKTTGKGNKRNVPSGAKFSGVINFNPTAAEDEISKEHTNLCEAEGPVGDANEQRRQTCK